MPIARSFNPDIVLVSSGFDAATGHPAPLGGYHVSPACFGFMTRELLQLANGKVVLALEGGYDLAAICDSAQECVRALLGDPAAPIAKAELERPPCQNAINTLQKTIAIQVGYLYINFDFFIILYNVLFFSKPIGPASGYWSIRWVCPPWRPSRWSTTSPRLLMPWLAFPCSRCTG